MRESPILSPRRISLVLLLLILVCAGMIRFRLRNIPLERDEGEYAYAGQLLLQAIPPYQLAYNMKLPGTYAAYALMLSVFGQTPGGVHIGLLFCNAGTIILIFFLSRRLFDATSGIVAAASYAILSVSPSVLGFAAHATHFVILVAVAGILLLLKAIESARLWTFFWSGILLGLSFLMKQPGILFVVFAVLYLMASHGNDPHRPPGVYKKLGVLLIGCSLPFVLLCILLARAGVFHNFWFWTVSYASQYATSVRLSEGVLLLGTMLSRIVGTSPWIWMIATVGLFFLVFDHKYRKSLLLVLGFCLFSFLAACPGLNFREHYFILMLPAISILAGLAVTASIQHLRTRSSSGILHIAPAITFGVAAFVTVYGQRAFLFQMQPSVASRSVYFANPFPEAIPIAEYIRNNSSQDARVAVLGSEPEIYFYAHRHSATGHIYVYGLMEEQKYAGQMQQEMIREIEAAQPQFLVFVNVSASWLIRPHSDTSILTWAQNYIHDGYQLTGIADIYSDATVYRWGPEAMSYQPRSNNVVYVFRKNR